MIALRNISKKFSLHARGRSILFKGIIQAVKKKNSQKTICALDNVTIDIKKGEVVGLIGTNGSGKSTLLKIICRMYKPTTGAMQIKGDVVPIVRLGSTFIPDLSVKDNIFLYGAIVGLDRKEVRRNLKKIIDFANVGDFVNSEARTLSLGMEERLAFSVVMQTTKDILLFDEMLSAGDRSFRNKSLEIINKFRNAKKTIIISSHDMETIKLFCDRTLLLDKGHVVDFGDTDSVVEKYTKLNNNKS